MQTQVPQATLDFGFGYNITILGYDVLYNFSYCYYNKLAQI